MKSYLQAKGKNVRYSQRAFARRLSISPGALSEILSGRRQVSVKLAQRFAERLGLDPQSRSELLQAAAFAKNIELSAQDDTYELVDLDKFAFISDWYHFGILSLLNTASFRADPEWIGQRLGITTVQATGALERLLRLKMIRLEAGQLKRTHERFKTTDEVQNLALRNFYLQDLDLIRDSFEGDPLNIRDNSNITMAINTKHLAKAKQLIRRFQDEMSELLEKGERDEVYRLSVALWPLSRGKTFT